MIDKRSFGIGMGVGVLAVALLIGIHFAWPILFSKRLDASYAIGQQMGRNFLRHRIDVSSQVVAAGIRDAMNDRNRLGENGEREALDFIHKDSAEKRKLDPAPVVQSPAGPDSSLSDGVDGWYRSRLGFMVRRHKDESEPQPPGPGEQKPIQEIEARIQPPRPEERLQFSYFVKALREQSEPRGDSKSKAVSGSINQLPLAVTWAVLLARSLGPIEVIFNDPQTIDFFRKRAHPGSSVDEKTVFVIKPESKKN